MNVLPLKTGIIYGPVHSRRLGLSLGVNLLPTRYKVCPFNCQYCHYGWTDYITGELLEHTADLPSVEDVAFALEKVLREGPPSRYITFSGNGEPSSHPYFAEIVDRVLEIRKRLAPERSVAILSNSTTVHRPEIRRVLERLDLCIMKLDCGREETFRRFNRPWKGIDFSTLIEGLVAMKDVVIQTLLAEGEKGNASEEELSAWRVHLSRIHPLHVQIYSIDRPAAEGTLRLVPPQRLKQIAEQTYRETGVEVRVY